MIIFIVTAAGLLLFSCAFLLTTHKDTAVVTGLVQTLDR